MNKWMAGFLVSALLTGSAGDGAAAEPGSPNAQAQADPKRDDRLSSEVSDLELKYCDFQAIRSPERKRSDRQNLAKRFMVVLNTVVEKRGKAEAISREDLDRMAALREELKAQLSADEGYLNKREIIESILSPPELPGFVYKIGVNGFLRGEGAGNLSLADSSYTPNVAQGGTVYRVKPYAYWHPTDYLGLHLEGQGYGVIGRDRTSHDLGLYQGFVEAKLPGKDWIDVKAGRQEFIYGSAFIQGADSFFDGLSFDAVKVRLQPSAPFSIDLLSGYYASPFAGGVKGNLSGAYASYAFSDGNALEAYGFRDTGSRERHRGEHLDSWGVHGTAKVGAFSGELEPVYQSGEVLNPLTGTNERISAYGGHADLNAEAMLGGMRNKFSLVYAMGSGTTEAARGGSSRKEFRNPNNDTPLVGDMHVISDLSGLDVNGHHASGMQIFSLGWGIDLTKSLTFAATGHYAVARAVEDGLSRQIGLETDFSLTYTISDDYSIILAYDRFFVGDFFRQASASSKDIHYGYAMLTYNFGKTKPKAPQQQGS